MTRAISALAALLAIAAAGPALAASHGTIATTLVDGIPGVSNVCAAYRAVGAYTGPLYQVTRYGDTSSTATEDVYPTASGWPDKAALTAYANGAVLTVTTCYDQENGGAAILTGATTSTTDAPFLNLDGAHPVFEFDGEASTWTGTGGLLTLTDGVTGLGFIAVRQVLGVTGKTQTLFETSIGTGRNYRAGMALYGGTQTISGAILDSDTTNARTAGLAYDTSWHVETGRWDYSNGNMYHSLDSSSEKLLAFEAGASTTATPSEYLTVGSASNATTYFLGKVSLLAFVKGTAARPIPTDRDVDYATRFLAAAEVPGTRGAGAFPTWGATFPIYGNYTLAPGVQNYLIQVPDGSTPSLSDLTSLRYEHHTRIGVEPTSGRIFVAHSVAPVNENDGGLFSEIESTTNNWTTINGPLAAVPNQSTFYPSGGTAPTDRYATPRDFEVYNGQLYFMASIDSNYGMAIAAVLCNPDGSLGTPFLITTPTYTPFDSTYPTYAYDPVLGPPLYALSSIYGTWQGTPPQFTGIPLSPWTGATRQGSMGFVEPATVTMPDGRLLRLWRHNSFGVWSQFSSDGGVTWTPLVRTNLPNAPSSMDAIQLSNGHLAVIFNTAPIQNQGRDPLAIALFNPTTGVQLAVYAVAQGIADVPTWPGNAKDGGPTYSGSVESSLPNGVDTLYISYSWHGKENISMAAIPVAGL